ncbi:MAG: hypothetical protein II304_04035 [Bacteroidales bacterium]|nr:hypothetical protein [Bacteroidales bacterium]
MRIEEIRINDILKCKVDGNNVVRYVTELNNRGDVILNKVGGESWESVEATIQDVVPVDISDASLKAIGAVKSPFGLEYILMAGGKEFFLKKDINSPLWICARLHKYRPPFAKVKFIHELQRYLLDTYMTTLSL